MNTNLNTYKDLYIKVGTVKNTLRDLFLEKAFQNRDEYALPDWLAHDRRDARELINTWCCYRHDGAFISIEKVKIVKGQVRNHYFISGEEDMEYSSDYVNEIETYELDNVAAFVCQYLEEDLDAELDALAKEIRTLKEDNEEAIQLKVESLLLSSADINTSDIWHWAQDYKNPAAV